MKRKIALVYGGDSSEWEISVSSGKNVASVLDRSKYEIYEILLRGEDWSLCDPAQEKACPVSPVDKSDFSCTVDGKKVKFDQALIMVHGTPGENGIFQKYLEEVGVPFTTCSSGISALMFDKYACKNQLRNAGIPLAKDVNLEKGDSFDPEEVVAKLGLPVFVKPNDGGSSFGVTKVKRVEDLEEAVANAFKEGSSVLIEEFIPGRELTDGVFSRKGEIIPLPPTEIISENEYFDYEAKYFGKSREVCPAGITEEQRAVVWDYTTRIYRHFQGRGMIRVDYIMKPSGEVYFLEINPVPGMTKMSLVPAQIRAAGYDLSDVMDTILDETL